MSDLAAAALRWTRISPVFPCGRTKRPITEHGFYDASRAPDVIAAWWSAWPSALIGIPTGEKSGLVVLDLDAPGEHKHDGISAFTRLRADRALPPHPVIRTRSGGEHHYFSNATSRQVRNRASKIEPGIDQRGQGGYVIVPPSPGYEAITEAWPPPVPPDWLLDLMAPAPKPAEARTPYVGVPRPMKQFEALVRFVQNATEGERNQRTYWAACRAGEAVALGHIGPASAVAMIATAARRIGLTEREATLTAASGVEMGQGNRP